jgi:hypothetical protein
MDVKMTVQYCFCNPDSLLGLVVVVVLFQKMRNVPAFIIAISIPVL